MSNNYRQRYAIEQANKKRLLKVNPNLNENSGIYILTRTDELDIPTFYVGQAKHILSRLAGHFVGHQHIDSSLRKHGFYNVQNPHGWNVNFIEYPEDQLDEMERYWILAYIKNGYQARYNKTAGGQDKGKVQINEYKPAKGYRDGLKQGRINLARELKHIIEKHLIVSLKPGKENNKVSQKAFEKFNELLNEGSREDER